MGVDADIRKLRESMSMDDLADIFMQYVDAEFIGTIVEEEIYAQVSASLTGATRAEILEITQKQGAELVRSITEQMRESIKGKVETALKDQLGVDKLARSLKDGLTLDNNRQRTLDNLEKDLLNRGLPESTIKDILDTRREELIADRAQTIAQTETRIAMEKGEIQVAKNRGSTHKVWTTSVIDVCEDCQANEAAGAVPINEAFPSGDSEAPAHPRCNCTIGYVTDEGDGVEVAAANEEQKMWAEINQQVRDDMEKGIMPDGQQSEDQTKAA